jgi:hypothetical protein
MIAMLLSGDVKGQDELATLALDIARQPAG